MTVVDNEGESSRASRSAEVESRFVARLAAGKDVYNDCAAVQPVCLGGEIVIVPAAGLTDIGAVLDPENHATSTDS